MQNWLEDVSDEEDKQAGVAGALRLTTSGVCPLTMIFSQSDTTLNSKADISDESLSLPS